MPIDLSGTLPFNHEQAVTTLMSGDWSVDEKRIIIEGGAVCLHHTMGTVIRNSWGLHERSYPLSRFYRDRYGIGHGDDMSSLILHDFVERMRGETGFSLEHEVLWLKKHWLDQGVDPLTLERSG